MAVSAAIQALLVEATELPSFAALEALVDVREFRTAWLKRAVRITHRNRYALSREVHFDNERVSHMTKLVTPEGAALGHSREEALKRCFLTSESIYITHTFGGALEQLKPQALWDQATLVTSRGREGHELIYLEGTFGFHVILDFLNEGLTDIYCDDTKIYPCNAWRLWKRSDLQVILGDLDKALLQYKITLQQEGDVVEVAYSNEDIGASETFNLRTGERSAMFHYHNVHET